MGLLQLLLPTRHLIWALSLGPFVFIMLMARFSHILSPFFASTAGSLVPFAICVALLYVIGGDGENNAAENPAALFLLFSLVMTIVSSMNSGELAARCRLIWLRQSGSRHDHWHYMERTLLTNVALTFALIFVIAAAIQLFSPTLPLSPLDYLLGGISCNLLGAYLSLTVRISNWSIWLQILLICVLGPGIALAFNQDLVAIPVLSMFILLLALYFRQLAQRRFTGIDWYRVKPRCTSSAWGAVRW